MIVRCSSCNTYFDDALRLTYCPHRKLMSDDDMAQKIAGLALVGKKVVFNHQPDDADPSRVTSCGWNGMVSIDTLPGEFAPHLFRVIE
jgi:hypothetical protein